MLSTLMLIIYSAVSLFESMTPLLKDVLYFFLFLPMYFDLLHTAYQFKIAKFNLYGRFKNFYHIAIEHYDYDYKFESETGN